jgi:transcriptional regulator with XRE-family HTH domain
LVPALERVENTQHHVATGIDVGARLRAVRTMYGMSQRELAKRAGVTNGLISLIEQNRVSPSVHSLTTNAHKEPCEIIPVNTPPTF